MNQSLNENLRVILEDLPKVFPETILGLSILVVIIYGLIRKNNFTENTLLGIVILLISTIASFFYWPEQSLSTFNNTLQIDSFGYYFSILANLGCLLTFILTLNNQAVKNSERSSEYVTLILTIALGAHLLAMSNNFITLVISLELLSIPAYVLTGFSNTKNSAEGSLKYFLFGSVATAIMIYGISLLYGLTGSFDLAALSSGNTTPLFFLGSFFCLAGYLYKISAAPLHLWAPDVYESAPTPVVALFSTVPKLAGIAALARFSFLIYQNSTYDWQSVIASISIVSMLFGNFSALWQTKPKRLMAFSAIAQSAFLLVGIISFSIQGLQFMMFYSMVYLIMNFIVFIALQDFENDGLHTIDAFRGVGKIATLNSIIILVGLISLTGIPPTGGFSAKLFIFSGLWESYQATAKPILLWLLIFGLVNTVVSLFYYMKIPYFSFVKSGASLIKNRKLSFQNFLSLILVIAILLLFIKPDLLMGWLNRLNFVL